MNNSREDVRAYIERAFADFPCTQATIELREELCTNLCEKFDDLVRAGMGPEEAYQLVIEGIGDLSELRGSVRPDAVNPSALSTNPPVRETRYGAGAAKAEQYAGVQSVEIDWISGDVRLFVSEDELVHVIERTDALTDNELFQAKQEGEALYVKDGRGSAMRNIFGFGWLRALSPVTLEVYLPAREWKRLKLGTISGNLFGDGLRAQWLHGETVSGKIELSGSFEESRVKTMSGAISFAGDAGKCQLEAVSGKLRFEGSVSECHAQVVSGSMELDLSIPPSQLDISAVSGRVTVMLPENDGFTLRYDKVSGHLDSDFPMIERGNTRTYQDGSIPIRVNTVSGNCVLRRK